MKKYMHLFLSMFFSLHLGAHDLNVMPGYRNGIKNAEVYQEQRGGQNTFVIKFNFIDDGDEPVCNYVPLSFRESIKNQIKRYHIPLSQIDANETESMIQYIEDLCQNNGINLNISLDDAPCNGLGCLFNLEKGMTVEKVIDEDEKTVSFIVS